MRKEKGETQMDRCLSRAFIMFLVCVVALSLPSPLAWAQRGTCIYPGDTCGPNLCDNSQLVAQYPNGNQEYSLGVTWDDGIEDGFGDATAFGVATQAYTNCAGQHFSAGVQPGMEYIRFYAYDPGEYDITFALDDWTVSYQSCNNGNPNEQIQILSNAPQYYDYWLNCF